MASPRMVPMTQEQYDALNDHVIPSLQQGPDKVVANESGATGNQDSHTIQTSMTGLR